MAMWDGSEATVSPSIHLPCAGWFLSQDTVRWPQKSQAFVPETGTLGRGLVLVCFPVLVIECSDRSKLRLKDSRVQFILVRRSRGQEFEESIHIASKARKQREMSVCLLLLHSVSPVARRMVLSFPTFSGGVSLS